MTAVVVVTGMAGAVAHGHDVGDGHISGGWGDVKSSPAKVPAHGGAAATKGAAREVVVALGLAVWWRGVGCHACWLQLLVRLQRCNGSRITACCVGCLVVVDSVVAVVAVAARQWWCPGWRCL